MNNGHPGQVGVVFIISWPIPVISYQCIRTPDSKLYLCGLLAYPPTHLPQYHIPLETTQALVVGLNFHLTYYTKQIWSLKKSEVGVIKRWAAKD